MDNISFVSELLNKIGVSSHLVDETNIGKVDNGMRGLLFGSNNYKDFLNHSLADVKDNVIYRYMDEYRCCYIVMKFPDETKYFFIGPYLTEMPSEKFTKNKVSVFKNKDELTIMLKKHYKSLPFIDDEEILISVATVFGKNLWGNENLFTFEYMDDIYFDQIDPANIPKNYENIENSSFHLKLLERNYDNEKKLADAVATGNINNVNFVAASFPNESIISFSPESLRHQKNRLIVLNTLLRKAAEKGGVHPLHIDTLSSVFSEKIERVHSMQEIDRLQNRMIKEYCFLVKKHSLSSYSPLVGRVITLIDYDITADLKLSSIAELLFVNPSYLSDTFSRETGMTLTEYVNKRRLEHTVMLLHKTDKQIQDIALSSGFSDANYFIRVFKKHYGITPTAYRKNIGKKS